MSDDEMISCCGSSCEGRKGMKKSEREGTTPLYIHKVPTPNDTLNPDDIIP
jgi:hypothetical protein